MNIFPFTRELSGDDYPSFDHFDRATFTKLTGTARPRPRSMLKIELENLALKLVKEEREMERAESAFWQNGGICCPNCGIPGWFKRNDAQQRRRERIEELKLKIRRDSYGF